MVGLPEQEVLVPQLTISAPCEEQGKLRTSTKQQWDTIIVNLKSQELACSGGRSEVKYNISFSNFTASTPIFLLSE